MTSPVRAVGTGVRVDAGPVVPGGRRQRGERGGAPGHVEPRAAPESGDGCVEGRSTGVPGRIRDEVRRSRDGEEDEGGECRSGPTEAAGEEVGERGPGRRYFGSVIAWTEPAASPVTVCFRPPGHSISHASMVVASPRPKCKERDDWAR